MHERLVIACGTDDACDDCGIGGIEDPGRRQSCVEAAQLLIDGIGQGGTGKLLKRDIHAALGAVTGRRSRSPADMVEAVDSSVTLVESGVCYEEFRDT